MGMKKRAAGKVALGYYCVKSRSIYWNFIEKMKRFIYYNDMLYQPDLSH